MKVICGCFQFFYASKAGDLPYPDIPTRDVTGTWHDGDKTEPNLEKRMENWCPCRARIVTANVRRALKLHKNGGRHYMVLTTNHPIKGAGYAVGIVEFSPKAYEAAKKRYPSRWKAYLPYVGSSRSKMVPFKYAFRLRGRRLPGKRYGIVKVPQKQLTKILEHFRDKRDQTSKFIRNIQDLEKRLEKCDQKRWEAYRRRKDGRGTSVMKCNGCCTPKRA